VAYLWFMIKGSWLRVQGSCLGKRPEVERMMKQDERWLTKYNEVRAFIEENHRNPSKHRIEEHDMLNWVKQQRKLLNVGKLKEERIEPFKRLLKLIEENKRINQYK